MKTNAKLALFALIALIAIQTVPAHAGDAALSPLEAEILALEQEIAKLDSAIAAYKSRIAYFESLIRTYRSIPYLYYLNYNRIQQWQYEVYKLKSILAALEGKRAKLQKELGATRMELLSQQSSSTRPSGTIDSSIGSGWSGISSLDSNDTDSNDTGSSGSGISTSDSGTKN